MIKVFVSKKLKTILKQAADKLSNDWLEQAVWHRTPTGRRNLVKVKSLSPEEQERYRPHAKYKSMSIDMIQSKLYDYQKNKSIKAFNDLYKNFQPFVISKVKEIIGSRDPGAENIQDLVSSANLILAQTLMKADPENRGVIKYIEDTVRKQLMGKSREIFRTQVTIGNKDRRLQRAVYKYINRFVKEHGKEPTDYDQMARDINKDPAYRVDNADAQKIQQLLQSQSVSIDSPIGDDDEKAGALIDILEPQVTMDDEYASKQLTPEEETIASDTRKHIEAVIDKLPELQQKIIRLAFGFMPGNQEGEQLSARQIAKVLNKPKSTVVRELRDAMSKLRKMIKLSSAISRIVKAYTKNIKIAYVPNTIKKIGSSYILDENVTVNKYASQFVCSCGSKNCLHKSAVISFIKRK